MRAKKVEQRMLLRLRFIGKEAGAEPADNKADDGDDDVFERVRHRSLESSYDVEDGKNGHGYRFVRRGSNR